MKSASIALATIAGISCVQIEKTSRRDPLLTWAPTPKKADHDMDYFIPHFGEDHDVKMTKKSWSDEEKR